MRLAYRRILLLAALSSCATSAFAQTGQAAGEQTPPVSQESGLEDIVVTAQRRSENLQKVPIAVSALSGDAMRAANITSTNEIGRITPSVTIANVVGFIQPRVRGVGNTTAGAGQENEVAVYVDGVYLSSAPGSVQSLSNVERVEVLKGPQGTLFGRNAVAGLIQIVTKDPTDDFHGNAAIGYANYQTVDGNLYLTGGLAQGVRADIAVQASHQGEGFGRNLFTGNETNKMNYSVTARSKWLLTPTETTTVRLAFDYTQLKSSFPAIGQISGTAGTRYTDATGKPIILVNGPWDTQTSADSMQRLKQGGISAKVEQEAGPVMLTSITALRRLKLFNQLDADATPALAARQAYFIKDRQFSEEFQIAPVTHDKFNWVLGLFYYNMTSRYDPFGIYTGQPPAETANIIKDQLNTKSYAAYGQATYEIVPDTNITGGIRYTWETRRLEGATGPMSAAGAVSLTPFADKKLTFKVPTWRVSLDHSFTSRILGYVSWNRGFKSGGFTVQSPASPSFLPEHLDAYETGLKTKLFDDKLRLNAAVFLYKYRDIQVNTYVGSIGVVYNGAKAENYGLDLDFEARVTPTTTLTGGVSLLHDRFTDFPLAVIATPKGDGTVTLAPGPATGNRLGYAPDATITLGVNQKVMIGGGETDLNVNNTYNSGYYTQPDNYLRQKSFNLLSASATWHSPNDAFSVRVWGTNLLNKAVGTFLSAGTISQLANYGPPRQYGVSVSTKF